MNAEINNESPFKRSGNFLSKFAHQVGERLPYLSNGISPETVASQGILKRFKDRFGLTADFLEEYDPAKIQLKAQETATSMVAEKMADEDTVVELRLLLPEESLRDPVITQGSVDRLCVLKEVMAEEHNICAVPNSHPIMPTLQLNSSAEPEMVWSTISDELGDFRRQMSMETVRQDLAVLAITDSSYAEQIFSEQVFFEGRALQNDQLMVLRHVGDDPCENILLPPRPADLITKEFGFPRNQTQIV